MMQLAHCNYCNKTGRFDIVLEFHYDTTYCVECHHSEQHKWSHYFCNLECMFSWLKTNEVEEKGFPCKSCWDWNKKEPSGLQCGPLNPQFGNCKICSGTKRVKSMKWPFSGLKND